MYQFHDKVVWVTGSSSGIGQAIALAFAKHGANLVIHGYKNMNQAEELAAEIRDMGRKVLVVSGHVAKAKDILAMVKQITDTFGKIDILVNNAGSMVKRVRLVELEESLWTEILDINLKSVYLVTKLSLPLLQQSAQARIINLTSVSARDGGGKGAIAYAAAKGGVSSLTRALAKDLIEYGITVNAIAPGLINTPLHDRLTSKEARQRAITIIPMGREGTPDEVAGCCLFLASNYADYITGQIIEVNGGL
jgi:3-oxoacyl-[acyl-carrier protein] reductase